MKGASSQAGAGRRPGAGDRTRFVVFAAPRTGSNWLCSLLDSHPRVLCHHEIFNPDWIRYAVSWRGRPVDLGTIEERDRDPLGFLQRLWDVEVPEDVVGLKLNRDQDARVFAALSADPELRKILLVRGNRIRTFVSETIALRTDQWESYAWSRFERNKLRIEVEPEELRRHIARNAGYYEEIRSRVRASGQPLLELQYERLHDPAEQNRVLEHLGAGPAASGLEAATIRLNPAPLRELVANFEQLATELRGTELEDELYA